MTLEQESIRARLRELDTVIAELSKYRHLTMSDLEADLSQRWIIERGLLAAASMIFDIANHILASQFNNYPDTYESILAELARQTVISDELYSQMKGLGGFRNILVHEYIRIDPKEVYKSFVKGLDIFPAFMKEIIQWLEKL